MNDNVSYWHRQLKAYIREFTDYSFVATGDYNQGVVFVRTPDMNRDKRATFIRDLERSGFTVTSVTTESDIVVKADDSRLDVDYT
jgi:lipocalin